MLRRSKRSSGEPAEPSVPEAEVEEAAEHSPYAESPEVSPESRSRAGWDFEEGAAIAEGRTVLKHLGGGSQYEVYLVWDDHLFAIMVAKVVRPDQVDDARAIRDLEQEAHALERLAHPVLVRGFGAVADGPHPHLLMEHLEGPTLRRLIKRGGPLPMEQILPLAAHVAAAVHYMAAEGMVHLDVKPENIVMGVPPRLLDLSIARSFERAAQARSPLGTDAYMPPEQCDPKGYPGMIGPPADVWGLGATLFHALTGSVPFPRPADARDSADLDHRFPQLVAEPEPLPEELPEPLRNLVLGMLAPDPQQRPSAAGVVLELQPLVAALPRTMSFARRGTRAR